MHFMSKTIALFLTLSVCQLIYSHPNAFPQKDESVVPQDETPAEDEQQSSDSSKKPFPEAAVDEYMKEHPDIKKMPSGTNTAGIVDLKRQFGQFGDVIAMPGADGKDGKAGESDLNKPMNSALQGGKDSPPQSPYPYPYPYPYPPPPPSAYPPPYPMPSMNPYYNQFPYNPMMGQTQGFRGQPQQQGYASQAQPQGYGGQAQPPGYMTSGQSQGYGGQSAPTGYMSQGQTQGYGGTGQPSEYSQSIQSQDYVSSGLTQGFENQDQYTSVRSRTPFVKQDLFAIKTDNYTNADVEQVISSDDMDKYLKQAKVEDIGEDQNKAENEMNEKMNELMKAKSNESKTEVKSEITDVSNNTSASKPSEAKPSAPTADTTPTQTGAMTQMQMQSMQPPMMMPPPPPYPMPYPMPYPPFPPYGNPYQNQYKIDRNHMQFMTMPLPNGAQMDPNLMKQYGSAQLDFAHARMASMPLDPTTAAPEYRETTESLTIEERPELPEVVIPKHKHKHHKKKHHSKKPKFLMRARLNNLPKKGQRGGGDQWWSKPVPDYCTEAIVEISDCKDKQYAKRWSFNKEDGKCYLYEDYCYSMKKNTFKSLKDCMTTCWRPE